MKIVEVSAVPHLLKESITYFWKCWGNESNFNFYEDCIMHSLSTDVQIPKFYVALEEDKIVGSYALISNDLISRQDLFPWFACLHVEEDYRNKGLGEKLLSHGLTQTKEKGFDQLYLSTDLEGFYEKKNWTHFGKGFNFNGEEIKIYSKSTH